MLNIDGQEGGQYVVADISGRELLRGYLKAHTGIDLNTLSSGIYLLRITTAPGKVETLKLLKQ
ncbi:MAG: T9SS type A sorting domain-containing protein [Bacteroidetes bacterium]|nr:T9SS type A sorting domain-containing protein [Bacteroidota bacterium]